MSLYYTPSTEKDKPLSSHDHARGAHVLHLAEPFPFVKVDSPGVFREDVEVYGPALGDTPAEYVWPCRCPDPERRAARRGRPAPSARRRARSGRRPPFPRPPAPGCTRRSASRSSDASSRGPWQGPGPGPFRRSRSVPSQSRRSPERPRAGLFHTSAPWLSLLSASSYHRFFTGNSEKC